MLSDEEIDEALAVAMSLAREAIETMGSHRLTDSDIDTKTNAADYVTVVDRMIERHVRETIAVRFPQDKVIGEEMGEGGGSGLAGDDGAKRIWYVDPVDGTTNYVFGLPWSSFTLGLRDEIGPVVGVVADPYRHEIMSAARGRGAAINGSPAHCRDDTQLDGALVVTEWSAYRKWDGMDSMFATLAAAGVTTRVMGSAAMCLAQAAVGRASAAVLGSYSTWDVLGAVVIARESGATVLGRDGGPAALVPAAGDGGILVAAPALAQLVHDAWTGTAV